MKFAILTLFPEMIRPFLLESMLGRAISDEKIEVELRNLREWATDKHKSVDDSPYGGGPGMVLRVDVIDCALHDLKQRVKSEERGDSPDTRYQIPDTILLTPQGEPFTQAVAEQLAAANRDLILIAGHYEGFDERIRLLVDRQLSLGDFVLTGGELPAAAIVDAVARLLPGVLTEGSAAEESFSLQTHRRATPSRLHPSGVGCEVKLKEGKKRLLEYPHYTRPELYRPISRAIGELGVPDVLKSGDHKKIAKWRLEQARQRTAERSGSTRGALHDSSE